MMEVMIWRGLFYALPINKLVNDDNVRGVHVLLERATCRGYQQVGTADLMERPDIGTVVHICWVYLVTTTMSINTHTILQMLKHQISFTLPQNSLHNYLELSDT